MSLSKLKPYVTLGIASSILFLSSCGTIFGSRYGKINVKSNVDSAIVFIDDKQVGIAPLTVKVRKKQELAIRLEKNGYQPSDKVFVEKKVRNGIVYADLLGAVGLGVSIGVFLIPDETLGTVVASVGSLILMMPIFKVEDYTQKGLKISKTDYHLNMAPKPDSLNNSNSRLLLCNEFNFKINPNDKIGSIYVNEEPAKDMTWSNTNNIKSEEFVVFVNNELEKQGLNVLGLGKNKYQKKAAQLNIEVEVGSTDLNLFTSYYAGAVNHNGIAISERMGALKKADIKLDLKWRIVNNKTSETVYEKNFPGYSIKYKTDLNIALYDAIKYSMNCFLSDSEAKSKLIQNDRSDLLNNSETDTAVLHIKSTNNFTKGTVKDKLQLAMQSVVTIETDFGSGSGFIISEDGYLVTNAHVVEKSKKVNVIFSNGFSFTGDVVKLSEDTDLALIKIEGKGLKPLKIANNANIGIGSEVYAIGAPLGKDYSQSITKGIVSGYRVKNDKRYIQTDVSISPGNSGGPLLGNNFEVIGVVQSKIVGEGVEGIGFCIPAEDVLSIFNIKYK